MTPDLTLRRSVPSDADGVWAILHAVLAAGETYQYTSGCMLETSRGTMRGEYQMERDDGSGFDAEIGAFALEMPRTLN